MTVSADVQRMERGEMVQVPQGAMVPQPNEPAQVMALMEKALGMGEAGVAALERLVELHDRVQRRSAELQFADALRRFRERCPTIPRTSEGKMLKPDGGVKMRWTYADFEQIMETIQPELDLGGFAITFDTKTDGNMMTVTGTLRHINGHSTTSSFTCPTESANPGMAPQHKVGGAETFCKRHVVPNLLGLSLTDPDPDAGGGRDTLNENQVANLRAMLDEVYPEAVERAKAEKRLLAWMGADSLGSVLARQYPAAVEHLSAKRKKP